MKKLNLAVSLALLLPTLSLAQVSRFTLDKPIATSDLLLQPHAPKTKLIASKAIKDLTLNPLRSDIQITLVNKEAKTMLSMVDLQKILMDSKRTGRAYSLGGNPVYLEKIERQGGKITIRVFEANEKLSAKFTEKMAVRKVTAKSAAKVSGRVLGKVVGAVATTGAGFTVYELLKPEGSTNRASARFSSSRLSGKTIIQPWIDEESKAYKDRQASQQ